MIRDHLDNNKDELSEDALRPRPVFLWIAAVAATLAVLAYLFQYLIVSEEGSGALGYALLLGILVILAIFFVFCYRMPSLGNRFLGYGVAFDKPQNRKEKSSLQYTGSFQVESGVAEKQKASQRKQVRHSRRKLAEVTRQMQAAKQQEGSSLDEPKA